MSLIGGEDHSQTHILKSKGEIMRILFDILIIILLPFAIVLAIWDGIIEFIKAFIQGLKDWSKYLV